MNTYFLFFGKSQDFTFYAFDKNGLVPDFNAIIKHFDQLESLVFSVDEPDNKDIIAKYVFKTSKGKAYSLLKQYSCAQAFAGDRLSGSTYGVAILSDGDVQITDYNLRLLKSAKVITRMVMSRAILKKSIYHRIYQVFKEMIFPLSMFRI